MGDSETITLKIIAASQKITRYLAMVGVGFMFFTTALVVTDVTGRYLFGKSIPGATESLGLLSAWISFPALAWALLSGHHVRVTLISQRLPEKYTQALDCLASLVGVFALGMMTYFAAMFFGESFLKGEFMMARINIPLWLGKLVLPIGFGTFMLLFLLRLIVNVGNLFNVGQIPNALFGESGQIVD